MLDGKRVVLGVSGGIAAYKACEVVSRLKKRGADVRVVMTRNATEFVSPLTFETLSGNRAAVETFDESREWETEHIALAKFADVFVVAPATANVIAKFAAGIADDMLSTTVLAAKCPKIVCPAMNTGMYDDEATRTNIGTLSARGWTVVEPEIGRLACGDTGGGRLAEPEKIVAAVTALLVGKDDYAGKKLIVSAGATRETIDGVRFISNYSSGKMGVELAKAAERRGARVTLVAASTSVEIPPYIDVARVETTEEMSDAVMSRLGGCDAVIMAAAPADYRPKRVADKKIKSESLVLELEKNPDIAKAVGANKGCRKLVIFAAETGCAEDYALEKMIAKNADMAVANDVRAEGAGFNCDTNIVSVITKDGIKRFPKMSKAEVADAILDELVGLWSRK